MAKVDYKELKKNGFIPQAQKDNFSLRVNIVGGHIKADQLLKVSEVAKKYGKDYVHMTSRQSIEIPFIKLEDIEAVKAELAKAGLEPSACGAAVRTITACHGDSICSNGLMDSTALAYEFDSKYHGKQLPHKFKIGITACPNNCLKAEENDLGVKGAMKPEWEEGSCTFCGLCSKVCRRKAITVDRNKKKFVYEQSNCNNCGRCVKGCPTKALKGTKGFIVYFGGLFGNRIATAKQLLPIVFSTEELFKIVDITLKFYEKHAKQGERFRNTVDRVGWDLLEKEFENIRS
ncbi:4Fe-4S binding protein [Ruminiclostridium herbifermentans]|uniref:4Fe-4S binding protein n=1 Tax=Ruminiclostridium herbifermentans TaxID=2488810 RepID=A0A4U7JKI3_9FIRM|nr:4Fe-4S dicluster domain-containing protein [Ruminiclostridium herbifermentans]QNU65260.1 4Fe-4S binding protein [Ruminiclostridium herbifermentans]